MDRRPERGPQSVVQQEGNGDRQQRRQAPNLHGPRTHRSPLTSLLQLNALGASTVAPFFLLHESLPPQLLPEIRPNRTPFTMLVDLQETLMRHGGTGGDAHGHFSVSA